MILYFVNSKRLISLLFMRFARCVFGESPVIIWRISLIDFFFHKKKTLFYDCCEVRSVHIWGISYTPLGYLSNLLFCPQENDSILELL